MQARDFLMEPPLEKKSLKITKLLGRADSKKEIDTY